MITNKYAVYAKIKCENRWSDWCQVATFYRAVEHYQKIKELYFDAKIYDRIERKILLKND